MIDLLLPKLEMLRHSAAGRLPSARIPGQNLYGARVAFSPGGFLVLWSALSLIVVTALRRRLEALAAFACCGGVALLTLTTFGVVDPAVRTALLTVGRLFSA